MQMIHPKLREKIDNLFVKCSSKISAKEERVERAMLRDVQKLTFEDEQQWELVMMPEDSDNEFSTTTSTHQIMETAKTVQDIVTFPKTLPKPPLASTTPLSLNGKSVRDFLKEMQRFRDDVVKPMLREPLTQKRAITESRERLQVLKQQYSQLSSINEKQQRQLDKLFDECAKIIAQADKEDHQQATPTIEQVFEGNPLFSSSTSYANIKEQIEVAPFVQPKAAEKSTPSRSSVASKPAFLDTSYYENKHAIKKTARKKDFCTSLIGMHKIGSDCFINAALQVIFSDPYDRATIKALPRGHELYFLKDLMESADQGVKVYTTGVRSWFAKNNPIMRQGQGDSTEALMAIRARLSALPSGIREEVRVPLEGNSINDFNQLALANYDVYHKAPEQFCFLIGRYQLNSKTVVEKINRPLNFSSAKLEVPGTKFRSTNKSVTYYLNVVIMHSGSAKSGHYIAYQKPSDGTWFKFDDGKPVVKVS